MIGMQDFEITGPWLFRSTWPSHLFINVNILAGNVYQIVETEHFESNLYSGQYVFNQYFIVVGAIQK